MPPLRRSSRLKKPHPIVLIRRERRDDADDQLSKVEAVLASHRMPASISTSPVQQELAQVKQELENAKQALKKAEEELVAEQNESGLLRAEKRKIIIAYGEVCEELDEEKEAHERTTIALKRETYEKDDIKRGWTNERERCKSLYGMLLEEVQERHKDNPDVLQVILESLHGAFGAHLEE